MKARSLSIGAVFLLFTATFFACNDDPGSGSACSYNSDCASHEICIDGHCQGECRENRDCTDGRCVDGACVDDRISDAGTDPTDDDGTVSPETGSDGSSTDGGLDRGRDFGPRPFGHGAIEGVVHFRLYDDSVLPIAEPIVYWTYPENPPEPMNPNATCDCGYPAYAITGSTDGTFRLEDVPAGWVRLVVQKGHFRRHRLIEVEADGTVNAPMDITELPALSDPENGDEIPNIVIGTGRFDPIEDIFAKLRMGPITSTFYFDYHEYMEDPSAWGVQLMVYQQPRVLDDNDEELVAPDFLDLLSDFDEMRKQHILFAPCAEVSRYGTLLTSEAVRTNIVEYVNEGGKLYVTDYAYDLIEQTFPEYIDFRKPDDDQNGNADGHIGDPDYMGIATYGTLRYQSHNRAIDPVLGSWLIAVEASEDGKLMTEGNWVNINRVDTVQQCCNSDGDLVDVAPGVVMSGPNFIERTFGADGPSHDNWDDAAEDGANHPHTIRFTYGCGEAMYSTYHTVEDAERSANMHPQELVLLYLILEIGECNPDPVKEPDPGDE